MIKFISVHFKHLELLVSNDFAKLEGIKDHHSVRTEKEYKDIFRKNAEHNLNQIKLIKPVWKNKLNN